MKLNVKSVVNPKYTTRLASTEKAISTRTNRLHSLTGLKFARKDLA